MRIGIALAAGVAAAAVSLSAAPVAAADQLGYIINVHLGPGYGFANADDALGYGYHLCDRIAAGDSYADMATEIKNRFGPDEYKVSHLLSQASQELCPAQIWALRQSVGTGYPPH